MLYCFKGDGNIRQRHTDAEIKAFLDRYQSGEPAASINAEANLSKNTFNMWVKKHQEQQACKQPEISPKNYHLLESKVKRLEGIIQILKKVDCTVEAPLEEKLSALERLKGQYNIHMLCEALDVPRGTFYNHIFRNKKKNTTFAKRREELKSKIQEIFDNSSQIYGVEKILFNLRNEGYHTSEGMVRELMRDMGLISIRQGAKAQYEKQSQKYKDYLKQKFHTAMPNQVWVSD